MDLVTVLFGDKVHCGAGICGYDNSCWADNTDNCGACFDSLGGDVFGGSKSSVTKSVGEVEAWFIEFFLVAEHLLIRV